MATPPSAPYVSPEEVSIEELARIQGVSPIRSIDELAEPEIFQSDAELDGFLADLDASRSTDIA